MKANELPDIWFGEVGERGIDWRTLPDEVDPDDEEMEQTPQDVIDLLGFDPKEFSVEEKRVGISAVMKGGAGSGSWNGPGDPRFDKEDEGKETLTTFHGTCGKALKGILKDGIVPQNRKNFEDHFYTGPRAGKVFVADSIEDAKWYCQTAMLEKRDDVGVVLRVEIPQGGHLRIDTEHQGTGTAFFTNKIPPEWIKGYVAFTHYKGKFKIVEEYNSEKRKKEEVQSYYVPIVIKESSLKEEDNA